MVVAFIFVSKLFMAPSPYFLRSAAADPARDFFLGFWLVSACYSGPGSSFFPPLSLVHVEQHFTIIISSHRSTLKLLVGREKKNLLLLLLLFPLLPLYIVDLCIKKQIVVIYLVGADIAPPSTYIYIFRWGGFYLFIPGSDQKGGLDGRVKPRHLESVELWNDADRWRRSRSSFISSALTQNLSLSSAHISNQQVDWQTFSNLLNFWLRRFCFFLFIGAIGMSSSNACYVIKTTFFLFGIALDAAN